MSPEFKWILNGLENEILFYNPEKCDIFSLGLTFIRLILLLNEWLLLGLND